MDLFVQLLTTGFVLGAIYALGAAGMTIIFGISGVLNLAHGGIVVIAAMAAWYGSLSLHLGVYWGNAVGIGAAIVVTYLLYFLVVRPLDRYTAVSAQEREVLVLVATLLVAIVIEGALGWLFGSTPISTPPMVSGVTVIAGSKLPINNILIMAIAWVVLMLLWAFTSLTRAGKAMLASSMSIKGLAIVGYDVRKIYLLVWGIYGLLAGVAGVLLGSFLGASNDVAANLTAISFIIVVLGGMGSVLGSLIGAYVLGFLNSITAYLISPALSSIPGLILLIVILYVRPQGFFGRH